MNKKTRLGWPDVIENQFGCDLARQEEAQGAEGDRAVLRRGVELRSEDLYELVQGWPREFSIHSTKRGHLVLASGTTEQADRAEARKNRGERSLDPKSIAGALELVPPEHQGRYAKVLELMTHNLALSTKLKIKMRQGRPYIRANVNSFWAGDLDAFYISGIPFVVHCKPTGTMVFSVLPLY